MVLLKEIGNKILYLAHRPKEVIPGELYRSGQLPPEEFIYFCGETGINSVINLRGENPGKRWFEREREACDNLLQIDLYNLGFSSRLDVKNEEDRKRLREFLSISDNCSKPVLFHCEGGIHRTGLACALYLLRKGYPMEEAEKQVSVKYGYLRRERPNLPEFLDITTERELDADMILNASISQF